MLWVYVHILLKLSFMVIILLTGKYVKILTDSLPPGKVDHLSLQMDYLQGTVSQEKWLMNLFSVCSS